MTYTPTASEFYDSIVNIYGSHAHDKMKNGEEDAEVQDWLLDQGEGLGMDNGMTEEHWESIKDGVYENICAGFNN